MRTGMTWSEALTLDALSRAAFLTEYSAQEEEAWETAQANAKR